IPEGDEYSLMSVDYSAHDFHESRAAVDAASRNDVRVRCFYWQLDQARPRVEEKKG
ncbi:hypothetical protein WUBG_18269, partial [Wuchereria bancrofti]